MQQMGQINETEIFLMKKPQKKSQNERILRTNRFTMPMWLTRNLCCTSNATIIIRNVNATTQTTSTDDRIKCIKNSQQDSYTASQPSIMIVNNINTPENKIVIPTNTNSEFNPQCNENNEIELTNQRSPVITTATTPNSTETINCTRIVDENTKSMRKKINEEYLNLTGAISTPECIGRNNNSSRVDNASSKHTSHGKNDEIVKKHCNKISSSSIVENSDKNSRQDDNNNENREDDKTSIIIPGQVTGIAQFDREEESLQMMNVLEKLTKLVRTLEKPDEQVPRQELIENLNYTIDVLRNSNVIQSSSNDIDELTSINDKENCPIVVREWISSTFTKASQFNAQKREKTRFKTVANAIRAGLAVERMYKKTIPEIGTIIDKQSDEILKKSINDWSFDIFKLHKISENHSLKTIGIYLFQLYDLISKFKIPLATLDSFLGKLEIGYSKYSNPYHNILHGADVAQTCHSILKITGIHKHLADLEILAVISAALFHDYEHTGTTNNFHVNSGSNLAILYNDRGVLENHHISSIFRLLKNPDLNILENLSTDDYKEFRNLVIEMVLSTDMSTHFDQLKILKINLANRDKLQKPKVLSLVLHCSDISHPSKSWQVHHPWTMCLLEEFFRQGDMERERNMPFSPLCDRNTTLVAESQIGFIEFIVEPSFKILSEVLETFINEDEEEQKISQDNQETKLFETPWFDEIKINRIKWKEQAEKEVLPS